MMRMRMVAGLNFTEAGALEPMTLRCHQNRYQARCVPSCLGANQDLHIAIEQRDKAHEALGGKAAELVVPEFRHVGLRNSEQRRSLGLSEAGFAYSVVG